jgi:hypothetical protein
VGWETRKTAIPDGRTIVLAHVLETTVDERMAGWPDNLLRLVARVKAIVEDAPRDLGRWAATWGPLLDSHPLTQYLQVARSMRQAVSGSSLRNSAARSATHSFVF